MTHPYIHAKSHPDKPAIIMAGSGEVITFSELDRRSNSIAHLFRSRGFQIDDTVAMCMDNCAEFFDVIWGAQRAGLRLVSISTRLTAPEMDYILEDSGAKMLIASASLGDTLDSVDTGAPIATLCHRRGRRWLGSTHRCACRYARYAHRR